MAALEEQYGVELSMLSSGVTILYSDFMDKKKREVMGLLYTAALVVYRCVAVATLPLARCCLRATACCYLLY
jgi:hypothetical protein